jgi:hypothetical protein
MSGADPRRVEDLFDGALDREDGASRARWLDEACGRDEALRREVDELLARDEQLRSKGKERLSQTGSDDGNGIRSDHRAPSETRRLPRTFGRIYGTPTLSEGGLRVTHPRVPTRMDCIADRYVLHEKLGEGGMGVVYRAVDRLTGHAVALKRVVLHGWHHSAHKASPSAPAVTLAALASDAQSPSTGPSRAEQAEDSAPQLRALAHEFRTLASIRHPHVISVLDYGFEPGLGPFFTMELLERARPLVEVLSGRSIAERVRLLHQTLQALAYVHRRGVLHRDLKPANVLVAGFGDAACVKVLDFGIACVRDHAHRSDFAGTIAYMAPELFAGREPSVASDIWSVGVMAYELLLGVHPLGEGDQKEWLQSLLATAPIFREDARLGPELARALRRALSRAPEDRYPDAAAFAHDLAGAGGLESPAETEEIRESYLQAAAFVAREAEVATLGHALDATIAGHGGMWLVAGESGVGKSRLLEELRTQALVRGTRVVRGQAVSAGGAAYQVWRGALRPLCLDARLDDFPAGVLRAAVPDIATLLGREVPDPPELDPQQAQARFISTVEELLLSRLEPLLLLLEDLQWADPASLAVLHRLSRSMEGPVLVIGSYRNDERPTLPVELPGARSLSLHRLTPGEITSLSASILGEVGKRQDLVALLARETEGNPFFVVEIVRALAQEVGALSNVGVGAIPSRVVAGGVQALLARKLGRVPPDARKLLCAAAVLGRELDLRVLTEEVGAGLEADLAACASASVLEVSENRWRFTHDKLREAVLAELADEERIAAHGRIARAIERAYLTDLGPHAAALAYHFDEAGEPVRATRYHLAAGESATRSGAMLQAIRHLERAVLLFDRAGGSPLDLVRSLGLLARAYHGAGRPDDCARLLERLLVNAGATLPEGKFAFAADIARQVTRHARFRLWPDAAPALEDPARIACVGETLDSATAVCEILAWTRSPTQILQLSLSFLMLAEQLRDPSRLAVAYAGVGYGLASTPPAPLVEGYLRRARDLLEEAPGAPVARRAFVVMIEGVIHDSRGEWEKAQACLGESIDHHILAGDWQAQMAGLLQGAGIGLNRGDAPAALDYAAKLHDLASRADSAHFLCFAQCVRSVLALRAGDHELTAGLVAEARDHNRRANNRVVAVLVEGASARCALRRGDAAEARSRADAALESMPAHPPLLPSFLEGPPAVVEVYAALWQRARSATERSELGRLLARALAVLRATGAILPIARSSALLWSGRCAAVRGHRWLGAWYLRRALTAAKRWHVPFDEALTLQALADVADTGGHRQRANSLRRAAREIFERLGAHWHVGDLATKRDA